MKIALSFLLAAALVCAATPCSYAEPRQLMQGTQVHLFVAAQRRLQRALALGEGWRIKHDGVVLLAGRRVVLQQVEGVALDPLDLFPDYIFIERAILIGNFERPEVSQSTALAVVS